MSVTDTDETDVYERYEARMWDLHNDVWNAWGRIDQGISAPRYQSKFIPAELWAQMGVNEPAPPTIRQPSHRVVRNAHGTVVTSLGLSFPAEWSDADPTNGVEVEVYAASRDLPADASFGDVMTSWLGQLVAAISSTVSQHGFRFADNLAHYGTLSMGLGGLDFPDSARGRYVDENGHVTALLGLEDDVFPRTVDGPLSRFRMVNVKLLTVAESGYCVDGDRGVEQARAEIAELLVAQGDPLWSSLDRPSVV
ncbi:hypothetical protein DFR74_101143 [Nocardia puris]|uniref:Suppressor of fused protein SUFU n=1 Tax=Nocardia puris TaxID=208602 RepID=A0A366E1C5_9NOCA|nr:hypothetical protein DFR74_101143 [Nocardia puris]